MFTQTNRRAPSLSSPTDDTARERRSSRLARALRCDLAKVSPCMPRNFWSYDEALAVHSLGECSSRWRVTQSCPCRNRRPTKARNAAARTSRCADGASPCHGRLLVGGEVSFVLPARKDLLPPCCGCPSGHTSSPPALRRGFTVRRAKTHEAVGSGRPWQVCGASPLVHKGAEPIFSSTAPHTVLFPGGI